MNIQLNEKLKHRLVGLAVILSIAIIVLPALMKKSTPPVLDPRQTAMHLPNRPNDLDVIVPREDEVFKPAKVAHVELLPLPEEAREYREPGQVEARALSKVETVPAELAPVSELATHQEVIEVLNKPVAKIVTKKPIVKAPVAQKTPVKKPAPLAIKKAAPKPVAKAPVHGPQFSVQVARLSQLNNAMQLVNRLKAKGYKASYIKDGATYKVVVGQTAQRAQAQALKQQLATAMHLDGFVVTTGIS